MFTHHNSRICKLSLSQNGLIFGLPAEDFFALHSKRWALCASHVMFVACTGKQALRTKAQFTSQLMSSWDLSDRPWSANQHTQMRQTNLATPSCICNSSNTIPFHELKLTEVARLIISEWERKTFLKISPTCEWEHTSVGPHVNRWSILSHGDLIISKGELHSQAAKALHIGNWGLTSPFNSDKSDILCFSTY